MKPTCHGQTRWLYTVQRWHFMTLESMTAPFFTDWMMSILNTLSFIIVGITFDSMATCGVNIESVTKLYRFQLFPVRSHTSNLSHDLPPLAVVRIFLKSRLRWRLVLQALHVVTEVLCPQLIPSQGTFPSGFCSLPPRVGCPRPRSSFPRSYSWQGCGEAENPQVESAEQDRYSVLDDFPATPWYRDGAFCLSSAPG